MGRVAVGFAPSTIPVVKKRTLSKATKTHLIVLRNVFVCMRTYGVRVSKKT